MKKKNHLKKKLLKSWLNILPVFLSLVKNPFFFILDIHCHIFSFFGAKRQFVIAKAVSHFDRSNQTGTI